MIPGDSGGPIINLKGEVAGIVSYIRLSTGMRLPKAYAVPITKTDARLADLRTGVKRDAPMIGIGLSNRYDMAFTFGASEFKRLSKLINLGDIPGAFFDAVYAGTPAAKAGLKPLVLGKDSKRISGDLVTEVNGKRVINFSEFQFAVRSYKPGDTITLTVLRDDKTLKVLVTLVGRSQIKISE